LWNYIHKFRINEKLVKLITFEPKIHNLLRCIDMKDKIPLKKTKLEYYKFDSAVKSLKRYATLEEVTEMAIFLALRSTGYLTGQIIHLNGGYYM